MNFIKATVLLLVLGLFMPTQVRADALEEKLTGMWRELANSKNLVSFEKGGKWKLFLKKGEIENLRSLDGTWRITAEGDLVVQMVMDGSTQTFRVKVTFVGEEMIITEDDGKKTRHKRHEGPLPEEFRW